MFVVMFSQVSNSADWIDTVELTSEDDGQLIDLTGWTVTMQVRYGAANASSPQTYYAGSFGNLGSPVLVASTANGKLTVPSTGVIQWTFRASELSQVQAGFYDVGLTMTNGTETFQLILGQVPIVNGGVQ